MKKILSLSIIAYLFFIINSASADQSLTQNNLKNEKVLKVGVLLPLSGEFQTLGKSFLKAVQLALYDISKKDIQIYPIDNKGTPLGTYKAAKEFEEQGIKIVIGPIFHKNLERIGEVNNVTFISLTNKTNDIPKNTIAFGINIESQINALKNYFDKIKVSKTLLLSPKSEFIYQSQSIAKKDVLKFYRTYLYEEDPQKITGKIEKITKYRERKKDLERRIKILEKSDLPKDQNELKKLEQMHTLGKINFDSVVVIDFGERLKSVLTSFMFADVSSNDVNFFTINQWFDETFFNENAMQNLHFPSIDLKNFKKFEKKYLKVYNQKPNEVSVLGYDALGLIYYCWKNNNFQFNKNQLFSKKGFKGLHAEFIIVENLSKQKLNIYKVSNKKFIKVF